MNPKIFSQEKEYVHARGSFPLLLLLLSLLIWWYMNKCLFSFDFQMLISCVVDIFSIGICFWCFYCQDLFLFKKFACYHIFSQSKNWFASSLDADLNFFQSKNLFASSLDADMNFSQSKKLVGIFIRCRSKFLCSIKN